MELLQYGIVCQLALGLVVDHLLGPGKQGSCFMDPPCQKILKTCKFIVVLLVNCNGFSGMINKLSWAMASQLPVLQITWKFPLRHLPAGFLSPYIGIFRNMQVFSFILSSKRRWLQPMIELSIHWLGCQRFPRAPAPTRLKTWWWSQSAIYYSMH